MNKQLHDALSRIDDAVLNIDIRVKAINEKLDELIAALHNYDDGLEMFDDEPKRIPPCVGHDAASWDEERMNIIGQNGNEGLHYTDVDENEFDDYGQRVVKDNNNGYPGKLGRGEMTVVGKDKDKRTGKQYWKTNKSKKDSTKYITNHKLGLGNKLG